MRLHAWGEGEGQAALHCVAGVLTLMCALRCCAAGFEAGAAPAPQVGYVAPEAFGDSF